MKFAERLLERFSLESLKTILYRIAFVKKNTFFEKMDPRILIVWYLLFAGLPWFFHNKTILILITLFVAAMAMMAKVSGLILLLMGISTAANLFYIGVLAIFLGGQPEAFLALLTLTLKLLTVALASVAVFAGMDPERFSVTLLKLGFPASFSFGVSYGYRMLPILVEEYRNLIHSFRLRGKAPERQGLLSIHHLIYIAKIAVFAFYPMMLNTAKRTRTTVEALEMKGFTYTGKNDEGRKLRLSSMKTGPEDWAFLGLSVILAFAFVQIGRQYPL